MRSYARHPCRFESMVAVDQWAGEAPEGHPLIRSANTANAVLPPDFAAWIAASAHSQYAGNLVVPDLKVLPCQFFPCRRGDKVHQLDALRPRNPSQYDEQ